jgi:hypothetical protein
VIGEKFYAPEVGVVLELTVSGGSDRSELISFKQDRERGYAGVSTAAGTSAAPAFMKRSANTTPTA